MILSTATRALDFLLAQQASDGHWSDYLLQPGASDSWITAYVGRSIVRLRVASLTQSCAAPLGRAATWLCQAVRADGGWGFNDACRTDSDTTAYAVSFLHELDQRVPSASYARLLSLQQPDGGFSTFDSEYSGDSWGISHPDVSAVVARAIQFRPWLAEQLIRDWHRYALTNQQADGFWPSFWWLSKYYSTYVNVAALEAFGLSYPKARLRRSLASIDNPTDAFQAALFGEILELIDSQDARRFRIIRTLIESQNQDGGWIPSAKMRVTNRHCREPWRDAKSGQVVVDVRGLFTAATVLHYLAGQLGTSPRRRHVNRRLRKRRILMFKHNH